MSALAQTTKLTMNAPTVETISTNARIDYILRFSKQAILIVDEQIEAYSKVGSLFLGALPADQNACFISISAKLNDIQIRCRIIEQLFGNSLFDPEQSLAVSIFNLAKNSDEAISIVIEHAHLLSLQLMYELCQLTKICQKTNTSINVLMLGTAKAGGLIVENKALFENKMSILSANTGQLLSFKDPLFKRKSSLFEITIFKKALIGITLLGVVTSAIIYSLYQRDSMSFSALSSSDTNTAKNIEQDKSLSLTEATGSQQVFVTNSSKGVNLTATSITQGSLASTEDILLSLTGQNKPLATVKLLKESIQPAKPEDIVNAIALFEEEIASAENINSDESNEVVNVSKRNEFIQSDIAQPSLTDSTLINSTGIENKKINAQYYQQFNHGFVLQFDIFSDKKVSDVLVADYQDVNFKGYYRLLNNLTVFVITSEHFTDRAEAEALILSLPNALKQRRPWIKSISAINNEINAFESSQ
ncbi:MAG: hypothetical protein HRT38_01315 [Alteromonadaceae bacterium]|nr:hypothetical protein [Alteromonadaceae bacterium]